MAFDNTSNENIVTNGVQAQMIVCVCMYVCVCATIAIAKQRWFLQSFCDIIIICNHHTSSNNNQQCVSW